VLPLTTGADGEAVWEVSIDADAAIVWEPTIDAELKEDGELKYMPEFAKGVEIVGVVSEPEDPMVLVLATEPVMAKDAEEANGVAELDRDVARFG
jgi:hypothetical protein